MESGSEQPTPPTEGDSIEAGATALSESSHGTAENPYDAAEGSHGTAGTEEDGPHAPFPGGPLAAGFLTLVALPLSIRNGPRPWMDDPWPTLVIGIGIGLFLVSALSPSRRPGLLIHSLIGSFLIILPTDGDSNGRAGQLLLFLPFWLALFLSRDRQRFTRRIFGLLSLLAVIRLLSLGSRGGLLAALIAIAMVAVTPIEHPKRAAFRASLALALVLIGLVVLVPDSFDLPIDPIRSGGRLIDGEAEGLTLDGLLSGRPTIWQSSLFALADVPISGLGPGRFEAIVPVHYPGTVHAPMPAVDDAHQFFLQTALDLGPLGLLCLVWLLLIALGRLRASWRASRPGSRLRYWTSGMAASLGGFLLYGMVDTVSLAEPSSWGLWSLLGLILGTRAPSRYRWPRWIERHPPTFAALALAAALVILLGGLWQADQVDRRALWALAHESGPSMGIVDELQIVSEAHPDSFWLLGLVAHARGRPEARDRAWASLLAESPSRIGMVEAWMAAEGIAPERRSAMAEAVVEHWPESGPAWLWLARSRYQQAPEDPKAAIRLFRQGLELRPGDGDAWLELGDLLRSLNELEAALEAYAAACEHGDPGANGCLRAGLTAENLGLSERARELYSQSRWPPVRDRAEP